MDGAQVVARWHAFAESKDIEILRGGLLASDVRLHTPVYLTPREGKEAVSILLGNVAQIFEDFVYHREFIGERDCALEFSASIGSRRLKGVDLIHWNEKGEIDDFEVMIRPANAIEALAGKMLERLQAAGKVDLILESRPG